MNPKELKKLAAACRAAGIRTYKDANIEFTLSDEPPVSNYKRKTSAKESDADLGDPNYTTDTLPEEALLFWSTANDQDSKEEIQ